jgi:hypothetical protein
MIDRLKALLRGDAERLATWLAAPDIPTLVSYLTVILLGSGLYGFTLGIWRAPLQSLYTAIKFSLLIFLTCAGNAVLNGMLAQILGSGLSFKQTSLAILMSFAIAAMILGGFSPITLFIWYNAPSLESKSAILGHSVMLLTHVCAIAFAGIMANRRLLDLLRKISRRTRITQINADRRNWTSAAPRRARRYEAGSGGFQTAAVRWGTALRAVPLIFGERFLKVSTDASESRRYLLNKSVFIRAIRGSGLCFYAFSIVVN